jgi:hypothetical protein
VPYRVDSLQGLLWPRYVQNMKSKTIKEPNGATLKALVLATTIWQSGVSRRMCLPLQVTLHVPPRKFHGYAPRLQHGLPNAHLNAGPTFHAK